MFTRWPPQEFMAMMRGDNAEAKSVADNAEAKSVAVQNTQVPKDPHQIATVQCPFRVALRILESFSPCFFLCVFFEFTRRY